MSAKSIVSLELDDIQAAVLYPRPSPYVGTLVLVRIDDRRDGRELLRRLIPTLLTAAPGSQHTRDAWAAVALSFEGLRALGVPEDSLATFPNAFQQGMAARANILGDTGVSAPDRWEQPLGSPDVHLGIYALAPDASALNAVLEHARGALRDLHGVPPIWQQDTYMRRDERTAFGFRDAIGQPAIDGSGIPGSNPHEAPLKAGEFVLGYPGESGDIAPMPRPEVLGRNGSYAVFRKLHSREAAFRQYLHARAQSRAEEQLLAAKFVGRWPSGASLVLAPEHDDPELGADRARNDAFLYAADDLRGFRCPLGAHARRMNPRDSPIIGVARMHRMIRRSTSYGPELPEGLLEDDGVDRGILFTCIVGDLVRQFEFVQTQWINEGTFIGKPDEVDPFVGPHDGAGRFTIPQQPIRRQLTELNRFVVNRGGLYCFMPGLRALRWIAGLETWSPKAQPSLLQVCADDDEHRRKTPLLRVTSAKTLWALRRASRQHARTSIGCFRDIPTPDRSNDAATRLDRRTHVASATIDPKPRVVTGNDRCTTRCEETAKRGWLNEPAGKTG